MLRCCLRTCVAYALLFSLAVSAPVCAQSQADAGSSTLPLVSIIIDDLGNERLAGIAALELPGSVSYAFLPGTPYARVLAELAHRLEREVLLHVPMEPADGRPLGPGGLLHSMDQASVVKSLLHSLHAVPHIAGVSNHMGSLLTARAHSMRWIMDTIRDFGDLYFVDSRTTPSSVAQAVALERGLRTIARDVFLDDDRSPDAILAQFHHLIAHAKKRGSALGIGHPYPETLEILGAILPQIEELGVRLVPVSTLVERRTRWQRREVSVPGETRRCASQAPDNSLHCPQS